MASGKQISKSELQGWIQNFASNKNLPFVTNSAAVSLSQLETFIAEAKAKYAPAAIAGFRIYFIRYPFNNSLPAATLLQEAGKNVSQPAIVLVPQSKYDAATGTGEDQTLPGQDDVYVLAFGESSSSGDDTTLCPPKCGPGS